MDTRRWTNDSIPRTLSGAVWFLYAGGVVGVVVAVLDPSFASLFAAACLTSSGYLVANARSVGWVLGVFTTGCQITIPLLVAYGDLGETNAPLLVASIAVPVATFALLVHPSSRDYQRTWFH